MGLQIGGAAQVLTPKWCFAASIGLKTGTGLKTAQVQAHGYRLQHAPRLNSVRGRSTLPSRDSNNNKGDGDERIRNCDNPAYATLAARGPGGRTRGRRAVVRSGPGAGVSHLQRRELR